MKLPNRHMLTFVVWKGSVWKFNLVMFSVDQLNIQWLQSWPHSSCRPSCPATSRVFSVLQYFFGTLSFSCSRPWSKKNTVVFFKHQVSGHRPSASPPALRSHYSCQQEWWRRWRLTAFTSPTGRLQNMCCKTVTSVWPERPTGEMMRTYHFTESAVAPSAARTPVHCVTD